MAVHRYILLVTACPELAATFEDLLPKAGVSEPLHTVASDVEAARRVNDPHHEPPIAVFVDASTVSNFHRLIGWIVSSPSTRLIPVFAMTGSDGPCVEEVEPFKPTAIISQPLALEPLVGCIRQCPLLHPPRPPGSSRRPPPGAILLFC
jgi:hypothetical protein